MKSLKKYLSILGIFTFFLFVPFSVQITQTNKINNINVSQNRLASVNLNNTSSKYNLSVNPNIAYAGFFLCESNFDLPCGINNFLHGFLVNFGNTLVGMSAKFMDFFLSHSLKSSSYTDSGFVEQGWEILRDVTNIVFIFALLYIAFELVLGTGNEAKKRLMKVILIALVINFSLFISYAIIDASNIFAYVFYNKIEQKDTELDQADGNISMEKISGKSASLAIANKVNPQQIFLANPNVNNNGKRFIMVIMAGAINAVMIYVFLSVAFLFLGRTIGLWISVILSPLAFASITIPKLAKQKYIGFENWFSSLLQMAFMAPIFLFILYLAVQFMNVGINPGNNDTEFLQVILNIVIPMAAVVMIILVAKKVANSMAGDFAGVISSFVAKGAMMVGGVGLAVATGGAAAIGRISIGKAAEGVLSGESKFGQRMARWQSSDKWYKKGASNFVFNKSRKAEKASFDIGRTGFGKFIGKQSSKAGLNMNQPSWAKVGGSGVGGYKSYKIKRDKKLDAKNKWKNDEIKRQGKEEKNKKNKKDELENIREKKEDSLLKGENKKAKEAHDKLVEARIEAEILNEEVTIKESNEFKQKEFDKIRNDDSLSKKEKENRIKDKNKEIKEDIEKTKEEIIKREKSVEKYKKERDTEIKGKTELKKEISGLSDNIKNLGNEIELMKRNKVDLRTATDNATKGQEGVEVAKGIGKAALIAAASMALPGFGGILVAAGGGGIKMWQSYRRKKEAQKIGKRLNKEGSLHRQKPLTPDEEREKIRLMKEEEKRSKK